MLILRFNKPEAVTEVEGSLAHEQGRYLEGRGTTWLVVRSP